jgi:threonine dehydrogenase-like Zn-dependent dehydrogenase
MCRNGLYVERGIKGLHGFASERYRIEPAFAVRVDAALAELGVLLEPTSVVAKAWEHVERIGARACFRPQRALVTGAGPIGLLAALLGVERGLDVCVLDRATEGPKPALAAALGAGYRTDSVAEACAGVDVVLECTGAPPLILSAITHAAPNAIVCLTGVSSRGTTRPVDVGGLNRDLVLENNVVFGSVNANRRHYEAAARALAAADRHWLAGLVTERVPLARWADALAPSSDDVKCVIAFG